MCSRYEDGTMETTTAMIKTTTEAAAMTVEALLSLLVEAREQIQLFEQRPHKCYYQGSGTKNGRRLKLHRTKDGKLVAGGTKDGVRGDLPGPPFVTAPV